MEGGLEGIEWRGKSVWVGWVFVRTWGMWVERSWPVTIVLNVKRNVANDMLLG